MKTSTSTRARLFRDCIPFRTDVGIPVLSKNVFLHTGVGYYKLVPLIITKYRLAEVIILLHHEIEARNDGRKRRRAMAVSLRHCVIAAATALCR